MKIGVVTFWHGKSNYGMMMQCWALQTFLKEIGHDPYVIRFATKLRGSIISKILRLIGLYDILKNFQKKKQGLPVINSKENNKKRKFNEFLQNNITYSTERYFTIDALRENPPVADCYITGSDQVWAQLLNNPHNAAYFLDFGKDNIRRIAYAPSFSMREYPKELSGILKDKLSRFDAISCREYDGVNICKALGVDAKKVLDPTLLLDKEAYLELAKDIPNDIIQYGFIYSLNILNPEQIRWNDLKKYSLERELRITVIPSDGYLNGAEIFGTGVDYKYSTPQEWIATIRDSEFVVTPSFHGIVFAILFNKPFVYTPLNGVNSAGNNRVFDLLSDLDLRDRILLDCSNYKEILERDICWSSVNEKLSFFKAESIEFLQKHLHK